VTLNDGYPLEGRPRTPTLSGPDIPQTDLLAHRQPAATNNRRRRCRRRRVLNTTRTTGIIRADGKQTYTQADNLACQRTKGSRKWQKAIADSRTERKVNGRAMPSRLLARRNRAAANESRHAYGPRRRTTPPRQKATDGARTTGAETRRDLRTRLRAMQTNWKRFRLALAWSGTGRHDGHL